MLAFLPCDISNIHDVFDPFQDYQDIIKELAEYDKSKVGEEDYRPLMDRKQIVVLNKTDSVDPRDLEVLSKRFQDHGVPTRQISAVTGKGVQELVFEVGSLIFGK